MTTSDLGIIAYTGGSSAWCITCTHEWTPQGDGLDALSPIYTGHSAADDDLFCAGCGELLLAAQPGLRIAPEDWELGVPGSG